MSKAERTRAFIVEKTAPIFNKKGYAGTSLSDMTEATGLTKGSIYGNFADKDEVALAALDYNLKKISQMVSAEMEKRASYRDKLKVYVEVYGNETKYPFFGSGCPIMNATTECDDTNPALARKAGQALLDWKNKVVGLIESGKKTGEFKAETNPEQAALTIISLIEGAILFTRAGYQAETRKMIINSVEQAINQL